MSSVRRKSPFQSTIGRKFIVGLTGLFLITFLIVHLSGNFLLFKSDGGVAFNAYGEFMATNPIIRVMEIVLFAGLLGHIVMALTVSKNYNEARPVKYKRTSGQTSSFFSRFMLVSGIIVLLFLILHFANFFVPHRFMEEEMTLYDRVSHILGQPVYAGAYLVSMVLLCFHLLHGFQSAFQTLGLQVNNKLHRVINGIGIVFAIVVSLGFASMPVYFLMKAMS